MENTTEVQQTVITEREKIAQEFAKRLNGLPIREAKRILGEVSYLIEVSTKSEVLVTYP